MILSDCACVRVQFADIAGEIASEPDVAFLVGCETVGPRFRGLCPILTEHSGPWIKPPEDARHLTRVPNCTVRRGKRVVRMRALCRHRPFFERDVRLRQRPQRSNSGDRQKTKKCGDRRGHNSSQHFEILTQLSREDAWWIEAQPDGFGEARLVFAQTNDIQLLHAFFATAKGHSGQRVIRFATRSRRSASDETFKTSTASYCRVL